MASLTELLSAALADPFRIVLLVGLVVTQRRTEAQTGRLIPLVAGVVFIAVILWSVMGFGADAGAVYAIGVGTLANIVWLVPILAIGRLIDRQRR